MSGSPSSVRNDSSCRSTDLSLTMVETTEEKSGRTHSIDLLRGIACASVVLFHYLSRAPRAGWMIDVPFRGFEPLAQYGYLGVHLFFMVSGYVIFLSAIGRSPRRFVASRVARLYPALWVSATLTMLLLVARNDSRFLVGWTEYLWNLTLIPQYVGARYVDGAYWSLAVELQFYFFVWIALRTGWIKRVEWLLFAWLLLGVVDAIRPTYPAERWLIANWAGLFVIGATTFLISVRGWSLARGALLASAVVTSLWHVVHEANRLTPEWQGIGPNPSTAVMIVLASAIAFVLCGTGRVRMRKSALTTISGNLTYPVYLIHQFAGYALYGILLERTRSPVISLVGTIVVAVATGALIHYFVERPLGPVLRRILSEPRTSTSGLQLP